MVTVLVASYNVEKYLRTCLDSLLAQTYRDWQAICIDDGSTDGTFEIIQDYADRDPRFQPFRLSQNIGKARAMNQSLIMARGEYICFLDADDCFSPDALAKAVEQFERYPQTDCVLFTCRYVDERTRKMWDFDMPKFDVMTGNEAFLNSLTWKIHGIYMTRTSIQMRYPYDESAKGYSEDNTTRVHYFVSREVRLCEGVYHYLQHKDSITYTIDPVRVNYLVANENMAKKLVELHCDAKTIDEYEHHRWLNLVDLYFFYFKNRFRFKVSDRKHVLSTIRKYWNQLHNDEPKFGYRHCKSWTMFRIQEEVYFLLRSIIKRA